MRTVPIQRLLSQCSILNKHSNGSLRLLISPSLRSLVHQSEQRRLIPRHQVETECCNTADWPHDAAGLRLFPPLRHLRRLRDPIVSKVA